MKKVSIISVIVLVFFSVFVGGFFIYLLSYQDMVFCKSKVFSGKKFTGDRSRKNSIPPIFHQTWKTKEITTPAHKPCVRSWMEEVKRNGYHHALWTDNEIDQFVKLEFPYYYSTWKQLTPLIKKIDTVRYMWMYLYGGVYADCDMKVRRPVLETLNKMVQKHDLKSPVALIPLGHSRPRFGKDQGSPAFVASQPGNKVWLDLLLHVAKYGHLDDVKMATGPKAVSSVLSKMKGEGYSSVIALSEPYFGLGAFTWLKPSRKLQHINTNGWENQNNGMTGVHPRSVPVSVVSGLEQETPRLPKFHLPSGPFIN